MRRLCKNCESFAVDAANGVMRCERRNIELNEKSNPPIDSDCWTRRPKLSSGELSKIRAKSGRMARGRPKGSGTGRTPTKQLCLHLTDYQVLTAYSEMKDFPLVKTIHLLCSSLVKQYPELRLRPEGWSE